MRLLGELACEELLCGFQRTITNPADESQSEHILASQGRLSIKTEVFKTFLDDGGDRSWNDLLRLQPKFVEGFFGLELRLAQVICSKRVGIDDDDGILLQVFDAYLKRSRIHCHEDIRVLPRGAYRAGANLDLIARYATKCALRSSNFRGEVGES